MNLTLHTRSAGNQRAEAGCATQAQLRPYHPEARVAPEEVLGTLVESGSNNDVGDVLAEADALHDAGASGEERDDLPVPGEPAESDEEPDEDGYRNRDAQRLRHERQDQPPDDEQRDAQKRVRDAAPTTSRSCWTD